jgi:FkbM family methyltransferase
MKIKNLLAMVNQILAGLGCQIVSSVSARHMSIIKSIRECGAEVNLLEIAIQNELCKLKGQPFNIVQIGANDGSRYDPYRAHIEKYGLSGVLVEPIPSVFQKLVSNYKGQTQLRFENSAIGPVNGEMQLYTLRDPNVNSDEFTVFSSFSREDIEKSKKWTKKKLEIECITVPVIALASLVDKFNLDTISLLAVDTEGFDYQILKSIDYQKIRPSIIEYEHSHLSVNDEKDCLGLLVRNGYKVLRGLGDDTLAILQ